MNKTYRRTAPGTSVLDMALQREEFGRRMRSARERAHLSQQEVADRLGIDWRQIQRYDSGNAVPRASRIPELAKVLGVEASYFEEPLNEHAIDRIDRRVEANGQAIRTTLALLDELLREIRENRSSLGARLEELEARQDAADAQLSEVQAAFLQALGVDARPHAEDAGEQATTPQSKTSQGTQPADGQ